MVTLAEQVDSEGRRQETQARSTHAIGRRIFSGINKPLRSSVSSAVPNRFVFIFHRSLRIGRSAGRFVGNHPTYATDPTGLFEGGSTSNSGYSSSAGIGSLPSGITTGQAMGYTQTGTAPSAGSLLGGGGYAGVGMSGDMFGSPVSAQTMARNGDFYAGSNLILSTPFGSNPFISPSMSPNAPFSTSASFGNLGGSGNLSLPSQGLGGSSTGQALIGQSGGYLNSVLNLGGDGRSALDAVLGSGSFGNVSGGGPDNSMTQMPLANQVSSSGFTLPNLDYWQQMNMEHNLAVASYGPVSSDGQQYNPQPDSLVSFGGGSYMSAQIIAHNDLVTAALSNPSVQYDFSGDQYGFRYVNYTPTHEIGSGGLVQEGLAMGGGESLRCRPNH